MPKQSPTIPTNIETEADLEERKRELAYKLWHEDGRQFGNSEHYWHTACTMIEADLLMSAPSPEWLTKTEDAAKLPAEPKAEKPLSIEELTRRIASRTAA